MIINNEYAKAYTEVLEILKHIPKEDFNKVPNKEIEFYKENMDKDYTYKLDETIEFSEQIMSDITKAILANIFRDYWATKEQQIKILEKEKCDTQKEEKDLREKYNPDNLFKNRKKPEIRETALIEQMEHKKQNFFNQLINAILKLFGT